MAMILGFETHEKFYFLINFSRLRVVLRGPIVSKQAVSSSIEVCQSCMSDVHERSAK